MQSAKQPIKPPGHDLNATNVAPPSELLMQGVALHQAGKLDLAKTIYQDLLRRNPEDSHALHYLGLIALQQERYPEAVRLIESAVRINRRVPAFHCNLGNAYKGTGQADAAIAAFGEALRLDPRFQAAYSNLGNILLDQGRLEEAADCFNKALALRPDFAEAHSNLGNVLRDQGKLDAAAESYRRALSLKPDFAQAYSNLLYLHAFTRDIPPEAERELAANWENAMLSESERAAAHSRALAFDSHLPRAGRKLKLGIVSAELGQHAVSEFLEPILEQLDRDRIHVTLYPTATRPEDRAGRIIKLADETRSMVGVADPDAVRLIMADQIDILIDTTGHMRSCRLGIFARRAAPVQCHYIGYHGTTGLSEMDWFIADGMLLPAAYGTHFRENIWRLPRLRLAYKGDRSLPASNWQPHPDGTVWLGSFNNLTKVREETLGLWARVMNAVPGSKLLLKDSRAKDASVRERITSTLAMHGVAAERVEFAMRTPDWSSHMAVYDRLDIALDAVPLNSETTAFDALWMGVPLVALEGNWYGGRMTSAILKAFGKPEWVARDPDQYVAIVSGLAMDVAGRRILRASQRTLMANSPLCDAKGLARALEDSFEAMFDQWVSRRSRQSAVASH